MHASPVMPMIVCPVCPAVLLCQNCHQKDQYRESLLSQMIASGHKELTRVWQMNEYRKRNGIRVTQVLA